MSVTPTDFPDFEAFWAKFLADHWSSGTRWMHVAALVAGATGAFSAWRSRKVWPLGAGAALAGVLAYSAHPLFQGDRPKNFRHPVWGTRGVLRLCLRTVAGTAGAELDALRAEVITDAPG
jgi:hypothetical protein